ncbi:hypothetical protein [Streptomyces sp. NBC_00459]|uniref:hypothetical protein n=1 Tax=Streptomyces sp. NBC_00459 TaxID=2975749 RepID=UPI002E195531
MPADEVTHGTDVDESRGRTGPRHAAPRKPLFTRFHMPAGKAIALAAMPTAVLMGMGFTPTLARADDQPTTNSMTAEEYQKCVEVVTGTESDTDTAATPSPSTSSSSSDDGDTATEPSPSATATGSDSGASDGSSDSGSDDAAEPTPAPSASKTTSSSSTGGSDAATPTPSASASATEESGGNLLETIGDAIVDVFTGGSDSSSDTASTTTSTESTETGDSATPAPTASPAPTAEAADKGTTDTTTVKDTTPKVTEVLKDTTDTAAKATEKTTEAATKAAAEATASPSPSASASTDAADCPAAATDDEGGVDNSTRLPDEPWTLQASSLLLKGADYQGIVKVRTADGSVKEVLKYVISGGTEIGDLHQIVKDEQSGKTYHAVAGKNQPNSTIEGGKTIMYTESISGNLLGLIPVTFSPKSPPPLNIPLIYFTNVKVIQAGQFGGTLTIPFLHQYTT